MKNLKRVLSLALSTAMLLGMMVVGSSAAAFADVDNSDHADAIGVVKVLGIMEGDENGNFNPDKVVSRNEMAVVMANLAGLKLNGAHPFGDVPAWADKYVGALYTNGLTSGTSATTYSGAADITTTQAALMIMKTLGYFEYQGEFGEDWELATIKRATTLDLFNDIDAGVKEALTRSELAQMVYNALECDVRVVTEKGGLTVEGNGITVTEKPEYSYGYVYDEDGTQLLIEKLFYRVDAISDLVKGAAEDAFGRPGKNYAYQPKKGDEVKATVYSAPDYVLVAEKELTVAELIDDADLEFETTDIDYDNETVKAGYVVELFVNADDADVVDETVIYYYTASKIVEVEECDEDGDKDAVADGAEYIVDGVYDIQIDGFDADEYVEGAYMVTPVLVTARTEADSSLDEYETYVLKDFEELGDDQPVLVGSYIAEKITGKAASVKAGKYFSVEGTKYLLGGESGVAVEAGTEYDVYVDANDFVLFAAETKGATAIDDVYVVDKIWMDDSVKVQGVAKEKWYAQLVAMDGEISEIQLEKWEKDSTDEYDESNWVGQLVEISDKKWEVEDPDDSDKTVKFKANDDKFDLAIWEEITTEENWIVTAFDSEETELKKTTTRVELAGGFRANSKTQYMLVSETGEDLAATVKTGGIALDVTTDMVGYIICDVDADNVAKYVIIIDTTAEIEEKAEYSEDLIFILKDDGVEDDGYFTQTVYYADGTKDTLKIADDQEIKQGFFKYSENEDGYFEIDEADALDIAGAAWDDEEGVIIDTVDTEDALFEGLLCTATATDIKVEGAKFVDLHDTDDDTQYDSAITSLTRLMNRIEKGLVSEATLAMNVSEDGAVVIFLVEALA